MTRRRTFARTAVLPLAVAGLLATGAGPAAAAPATDGTLAGTGLHIATGSLVDPVGRTWVSDHIGGFCRLTEPTDTAPGQIEHPAQPDAPGARTCLGGLLPDAQPGPDAAGQPTLVDPSPEFIDSGDEMALIPDGASPSSQVVRAQWNPSTRRFDYLDTVTMNGDRGRPVATSLGIDDNVYVTFQREGTIQRIVDPTGTPSVQTVAPTSDGRGAAAVAAGRDAAGNPAVYVAESTGVRILHPDAPNPATEPSAFTIPTALPGAEPGTPAAIGALAYDDVTRTLWAGTSDAAAPVDAGVDRIVRIDTVTGTVTDRASGFSGIGGVAVRPDGEVDVLDDPALLDPVQPLGLGRRFRVGRPVAHVARGPLVDGAAVADGRSARTATPTFEIGGDADAALECLFSGPGFAGASWQPCAAGAPAEAGRALADGAYTLSVRAAKDGITGYAEAKAFLVDTRAPLRPRILKPVDGSTVSGSPWYQFDAEDHAAFRCRFDDEPDFAPCSPGRARDFAVPGQHRLEIVAVDVAGNPSDASQVVTFTVNPDLPPTRPSGLPAGPPRHTGSSLAAEGLHIATGAIVDPDGRTWVSDHNGGFCRVTDSGDDGPGRIDHPQHPGDPGPRTCLGGLLPEAGTGPDAAGAPALVDPTPARFGNGDEVVLIPDGASASSDVVRAKWNRTTDLFEYLDTVTTINTGTGRGTRPVAVSASGSAAFVVFQKSGTVQRIANAAGAAPVVRVVGTTSDGGGAAAVAVGRDALGRTTVYIGEGTGLTSLRPNAGAPPAATASFALPPTDAVAALGYDNDTDRLWIGATGEIPAPGIDRLHRVSIATGSMELGVATGYSMIGGLTVRPDGFVLVFDDPALLDVAQPLGMGRMHVVGLPAAHVTRGPLLADGTEAADRGWIASRTPAFDVAAAEGATECRLRAAGADLDSGWGGCPPDGHFPALEPLAEGAYVLTVRGVDGDVTGLVERHRFTVDVTAPAKPSITSPTAAVVGATPWFAFDAEPGARFRCRWDETGDLQPCSPGRTRSFAENGDHVLEIQAIDRAGNVSDASDPLRFAARANVTRVTITGPEGRTTDNNPLFGFSADAVEVEFGCRLLGTGEAFRICTTSRSYTALRDGTYTFEVRARDGFGNVTPLVRRTIVIDRTGPVMTVDVTEGESRRRGDVLTISAGEPASWRCGFDGEALAPCGAQLSLAHLGDGAHVLQVVGTDDLGNEGAVLTRAFVIEPDGTPVVPKPPIAPTLTVVTRGGQQLTFDIAAIDPTIDLAQLRAAGITVEVIPARGLKLIRFRVYRLGGAQRRGGRLTAVAARARTRIPMLTVFKRVPRRGGIVRLTGRELRGLKAGRYVLEVAPAKSRTRVGRPVQRTLRVVG